MSRHPYRSTDALLDDCAAAAADQIIRDAGGPAWDAAGFARLLDFARERLAAETADVVARVAQVLAEAHAAEASLAGRPNPALAAAFDDMRSQLQALIYPGFISATGTRRLADLVRYLQAITRRLEKAPESPARDAERMAAVHRVAGDYESVLAELPPSRRQTAGRPGGALDDRGVPGQPVRPAAGHPRPGVRAADRAGPGPAPPLSRAGAMSLPPPGRLG